MWLASSAGRPRIYYELYDLTPPWAEGRTPLLLIHGLHSSSRHWFRQIPVFCRARPVVTMDLRGHGQSDQPDAGYAVADHVGDLERLVDELRLEHAHVVGGSMGGWLGQQLACRRPELVRSLTLVGSSATAPEVLDPATVATSIRQRGARAFFEEGVRRRTLPRDADPRLITFVIDVAASQPDAIVAQRAYEGLRYDGRDDLKRITCPVLVLTGEHDGTTPPACVDEVSALVRHASRGIVPGCGHLPQLEDWRTFNSILERFLASVEADQRPAEHAC